MAVSGDGRLAVSASDDKTLKVWDVDSGRELRTLRRPLWLCQWRGVEWGRAAGGLCFWDNTLKVWEVDSGRELRTLQGHTDRVNGVAVSGDGRRAVSASYDKTLKVWEVDSGRELRTLQRPLRSGQWRGGERGREAGGLRFLGPDAEGVGAGQRARAAHAERPLGCVSMAWR